MSIAVRSSGIQDKLVDAGWVRVEFGQSGADGAPDFLGFGAFPWFSRFEVICKGGGAGLGTGFSAKSGLQTGAGQCSGS